MLPAGEQQLVVSLYEQLSTTADSSTSRDVFRENITKDGLTGRVHAEVFLLEHFYLNEVPVRDAREVHWMQQALLLLLQSLHEVSPRERGHEAST